MVSDCKNTIDFSVAGVYDLRVLSCYIKQKLCPNRPTSHLSLVPYLDLTLLPPIQDLSLWYFIKLLKMHLKLYVHQKAMCFKPPLPKKIQNIGQFTLFASPHRNLSPKWYPSLTSLKIQRYKTPDLYGRLFSLNWLNGQLHWNINSMKFTPCLLLFWDTFNNAIEHNECNYIAT